MDVVNTQRVSSPSSKSDVTVDDCLCDKTSHWWTEREGILHSDEVDSDQPNVDFNSPPANGLHCGLPNEKRLGLHATSEQREVVCTAMKMKLVDLRRRHLMLMHMHDLHDDFVSYYWRMQLNYPDDILKRGNFLTSLHKRLREYQMDIAAPPIHHSISRRVDYLRSGHGINTTLEIGAHQFKSKAVYNSWLRKHLGYLYFVAQAECSE